MAGRERDSGRLVSYSKRVKTGEGIARAIELGKYYSASYLSSVIGSYQPGFSGTISGNFDKPANRARHLNEAFRAVESVASLVVHQAFQVRVFATLLFEVGEHAAQHLASVATTLAGGRHGEQVNVSEAAVLIHGGAGHGDDVTFGFGDQYVLGGEDVGEAEAPAFAPVFAVEGTEDLVRAPGPGDGGESLDDHFFQGLVVGGVSEAEVERHRQSGIVALGVAGEGIDGEA
jgi:hypothetical protein